MQAGEQQTASQRSGCWGRTVTQAPPHKWLFVAAGNAATFPNIKSPGILLLRSSLFAEIKRTISVVLAISVRDCGWEKERGRYTEKEEQCFFFYSAHRASDPDLLNERGRHVSLHHLVFGGLNCFLPHLQHTQMDHLFFIIICCSKTGNGIQVSTINSMKGERVCIGSHLFQPCVHVISLRFRGDAAQALVESAGLLF